MGGHKGLRPDSHKSARAHVVATTLSRHTRSGPEASPVAHSVAQVQETTITSSVTVVASDPFRGPSLTLSICTPPRPSHTRRVSKPASPNPPHKLTIMSQTNKHKHHRLDDGKLGAQRPLPRPSILHTRQPYARAPTTFPRSDHQARPESSYALGCRPSLQL
ncbi:hypothetical protein K458DRAFT_413385 [Lentithecium fluviatile CBS 122367]|uniref:Uncharacterized protein n=1 Tax=Lentithecium fluviatile CBS 122367 TaxID=1168545 RepID=A0A6G1JFX4_9PLEO|nr:hypothetical protein K458DRAFT_413385 [Lentithecium fluviatile CBS 122367]